MENKIFTIYEKLLYAFGYQNWWPVHQGVDRFLEVSVGAILTQNTNWSNVEKAIENLIKENLLEWEALAHIETEKLEKLIRPAGFYRQKAGYIKNFVNAVKNKPREDITRDFLLSLTGIGEETADSILLYGLDRPYFVVDAYTKRLFYRAGIINSSKIKYPQLQKLITDNIPQDLEIYKEYHALIVELGKNYCKKKPVCENCPIKNICQQNLK